MSGYDQYLERVREYEDTLRKMSDNRLRVEWDLVMEHPNKYSGGPLKYKLDKIRQEAKSRKYWQK